MFLQFKRLWKKWKIGHCRRKYSFLPRRAYTESTNGKPKCCGFLRGFYCISESLPLLETIIFIIVLVVIILILNGITVTDIMYRIGWMPTVVISISTLNSVGEVNFPEGLIGSDLSDIEHHAKRVTDDAIIWKVDDGFTKYLDNFGEDRQNSLGKFGWKAATKLDKRGQGFWVYRYDPPRKGAVSSIPNGGGVASIRALRITDHMNISPEEVEVAVAIRAYIDGEATIVIKYEDSLSKHVHTEIIKNEEFKDKGFCYKILDIPFNKRINMIHIRPTSTNLKKHGIVVVDQVLIVVAKRDISESILHTLVPNNWCSAKKD